MSTSDDAPLLGKAVSSRRRRGAALAAVALALAGVLAFAVANRSETTTSLMNQDETAVHGGMRPDAYARALPSTSQDATNSKGESIILPLSQTNTMTQFNSGLHGKVGSIEKWCGGVP